VIWVAVAAAFAAIAFSAREEIAIVAEEIMSTPNQNWTKWDADFKAAAKKYGVPWTWLKAISLNESSLGTAKSVAWGEKFPEDVEKSKSSDGKSWGLMQVTLTTARGMDPFATEVKLNNAKYSIDLGARYLGQMYKRYPQVDLRHAEWVVKSYNQGPGNTDKERRGEISGYAEEYWARFKRNLQKVEA
jgi:soluble lytic murein transglycosylase-like protein